MKCDVIAVSRSLGAGGEEIAHGVASELGFRYVDDEIVQSAASPSAMSPPMFGLVPMTTAILPSSFLCAIGD